MAEGMFSHLINIIFQTTGAKETTQEVTSSTAAIQRAFGSISKGDLPKKLQTQLETLGDSMKGLGLNEAQITSVFQSFQAGTNITKITTSQVGLLRNSLLNAGATKPQINSLMKSLDAKGVIPVKQMGDFEKALRRVLIVAPVWMAFRAILQSVFRLISSQIKFIKDMEDAMARIKIVGKGTAEQYESLKFSLIGLSLAYGVSASEAMEAAKIFAQQGKTVSETLVLTRAAMIGAQVLGQDVKTTVEDLTAAMKAFGIPTQDAISVIDKLINVEKQFAVTSKDLSEGIKRVGATAAMVGVSLAALTGDITAVVEVTRKSGAEAARGLQFIYARLLTSAKPVIEQLTGINFYLDEQGKSTSALTGKLRIATDILDEIAGKWAKLSREEKLSIAVSLGSKRQLVVLNALMLNYAHSIDARIAALTSAGEAEKALAIIQDTVTFKTKQLSAAWNTLTVAVADTSAWKGMLDILGKIIIGLTSLINFEKAYRVVLAQQTSELLANIETRRSQINSIEELIKLRNKLLTEPPSDKTTERIEKLNKAIEVVTKQEPKIKIALETGSPAELKKAIEKINEQILIQDISLRVNLEFAPQLTALKKRRSELERIIKKATFRWGGRIKVQLEMKEIQDIDNKILEINKKQTEEQENQLVLAKAQRVEQEIMADAEEDELRLSGELTEKEKEELEIARKLINFKLLGATTTEQQIQKEIALVNTSKFIFDLHEKTLKLAQLENQLVENRTKLLSQQADKVKDLFVEYAKGTETNKVKIERLIELMIMSPEKLAEAYKYSGRAIRDFEQDSELILNNAQRFSESQNEAVRAMIIQTSELKKILMAPREIIKVGEMWQFKEQPPTLTLKPELIQEWKIPEINIPAITTTVGNISVNINQYITEVLKKGETSEKILIDLADTIKKNPELLRLINEQIEKF